MKLLGTFCAVAVLAASAGIASADTLTLASYGSTNTAPTGVSNTATVFTGGTNYFLVFPYSIPGGATYNIGTGNVWTAPTGSSSWVSQSRGNSPGGSNTEPYGVYDYQTTFLDSDAALSTGTITVMADDTTSISLNGHLIVSAASFLDPATSCTATTPNCLTPETYTLTGFVNGLNTITFDVDQDYGAAEGLDFSGTVNVGSPTPASVTPEPSSLFLLGSGLMSMAGLLYHRRVQV